MAVKIIRMKSGEDVIGEVVLENTEYITVGYPAVLMPMMNDRGTGQPTVGMVPWQPFSKAKEFEINREWTVTISEPNEDVVDNYRRVYGSGIEVPPKKLLLS